MKLSRIIDLKFQRILLLNLLVAGIVLVIYGYMFVRQTQDRATQFIQSHVSQIVQAESSAQNVAEIDREVGRVFDAWKSTQDLEIKVDVFLDKKLVAHAGDLQDLGILSVKQSYNSTLPSGQLLVLEIQMSILNHVLFVSTLLSALVGFLLLIFFTFKRSISNSINSITKPLEDKINWLNQIATALPESIRQAPSLPTSDIYEIFELDRSLKVLLNEILGLEEKVATTSFAKARLEMSEQVAHNLKGAITTLQMRIRNSEAIGNNEKDALLAVIDDIEQVSRRLLKVDGETVDQKTGATATVHESFKLSSVLSEAVTKKKEQWANRKDLSIKFIRHSDVDPEVTGSRLDIEAAVRDLIDNSVEATTTNGMIRVTLDSDATSSIITVEDNGRGIPEHILPQLGNYRSTFGKPGGNGLGLYHAKNTLQKINGELKITSKEGRGTKVQITISTSQNIESDSPRILDFVDGQTVVIVDDDKLIHDVWRIKLAPFVDRIQVVKFLSASAFDDWIATEGFGELGSRTYLFDYDLKNEHANGLTLIRKHELQYESYLITGMANAPEVRSGAKSLGVQVIPKDDLSQLVIEIGARIENTGMSVTI